MEGGKKFQYRDGGHLEGNDQKVDHKDEETIPSREFHSDESIGRQSRNENGQCRGRDGDPNAVEKASSQSFLEENFPVILQRELKGSFEGRPPTRCCNGLFGPKRTYKEVKGRQEPDKTDEDDGDMERTARYLFGEPNQKMNMSFRCPRIIS